MGTKGQAFAEFMLSLTVLIGCLGPAGWLIQSFWRRTQCSYWVFEAAHRRRFGESIPTRSIRLYFTETGSSIRAVGYCGDITESVELPLLESAQW